MVRAEQTLRVLVIETITLTMYLGRPTMAKKIIFIHGRDQKPDKAPLQALWYDAIEHGLQRDCGGSNGLQAFRNVEKRFVYYGELSNSLLKSQLKTLQVDNRHWRS